MSKSKTTAPRKAASQPRPRQRALWPLYLMVIAVALIAAGAFALSRQPPAARPRGVGAEAVSGAQLAVDRDKIDFGDVKVNKMVEAGFVVSNRGTEPLQILGQPKVRLAQGC
jgi:hypothetical protein